MLTWLSAKASRMHPICYVVSFSSLLVIVFVLCFPPAVIVSKIFKDVFKSQEVIVSVSWGGEFFRAEDSAISMSGLSLLC